MLSGYMKFKQRTCSLAGQGGKVVHICHALGTSLLSSGAQIKHLQHHTGIRDRVCKSGKDAFD